MPKIPGAHLFNQPHHKSQKERNHNEQRERKKQQCVLPCLFFLLFLLRVGVHIRAQGWVLAWSTKQTIEFHFLPTPELGQDVWGWRVGLGLGSEQTTIGLPLQSRSIGCCRNLSSGSSIKTSVSHKYLEASLHILLLVTTLRTGN